MRWDEGSLVDGPLPLWWQIADRLRQGIAGGSFLPGQKLPSESELNDTFGVSRTTARTALNHLEQEGLIARRAGRGSIVLDPQVNQPVNRLSSFAEDMRATGLRASYLTRSSSSAVMPIDVASALGLPAGTPALRIDRLLKAEGVPIGHAYSWLPETILRGVKAPRRKELDKGSLYQWLERHCDARIVQGTETIEAERAGEELAGLLDVPVGSAILVARRSSFGADDAPIEHAIIRFRADRYRFRVSLVRGP